MRNQHREIMPRHFAKPLPLLIGLMAATITTPARAKTFDVAPGTNALLLARDTVRTWRAAGHTNEPVVIRLAPGKYTLAQPLLLTAQDGNVTWQASDSARTIISGGSNILGFTPDATGVWRAKTNLRFEQLYINGRRATRAKLPADGYFKFSGVKEEALPDGKARLRVTVPAAAVAALESDAALQEVQLLVFHKWDTSRYGLAAADTTNNTITVIGTPMKPWNPWNDQSRFLLENCPAGLTNPGGWLLESSGDLSYRPRPGERADGMDFTAPVVEKFLEIRGANNLHFLGLNFQNAGYRMPADGCPPAQAAAMIGASIEIDDSQNVTFENCGVAHTGNYAIWFRRGCHDGRVEHCLLEDLGAGGIRIGETEIRGDAAEQTGGVFIDNNIIRGCGRVHPSAVGVWIGQSGNNRVTHNDINDTFYTGISVGWTWGYGPSLATNNFIGFNCVHKIGQGALSDMGGIYTLGVSPGSVCVGNVFFDVRAHDYGGWGIYPDEGSTGWQIVSNLVWNCASGGNSTSGGSFHQHYGASNFVANNVFAFNSGPPMQATRAENHLSFTLMHNLIVMSNTPFFTGPWAKIQFQSCSNCFACTSPHSASFPDGELAAWQKTGHETGSILTNIQFLGNWPDVSLPRHSPAFKVGFEMFDTKQAGVYGESAWKREAVRTN
jgi:hypothetical protein